MWKHHHSAAGKGAEQSAAMAGPAWHARLAGLFYCIQVYACRLGPHHVFGQG